ncbi:MAG TPA: endonuclease III [Candidatus Paceibacterota bacterium]|nr:endonuclease III [Candidatus Paceibacterota bacterium]
MIPEKDLPRLKKRWQKISKTLSRLFPKAHIALNFGNPWELLVAVQLSAQCTDKKVNQVTPALFKKYPTLASYVKAGKSAAGVKNFENAIHACGFYRAKTRNILGAAHYVQKNYDGVLPKTMAEMTKIPGVGRKSANVILGNAYHVVEGIAVDTHVMRLSQVLGLTKEKTPEKIEQDLMKIIPKKDWFRATYMIIDYGRAYCVARPHRHELCPLTKVLKTAA